MQRRWWVVPICAALIALAALGAYHNSFGGPFILDDIGSIPGNPTIRNIAAISDLLSPPRDRTVSGRPVVNLSLAVDYALGGTDVRSYHVTNLVIHILAALTLFGLLRRTLLLPGLPPRWSASATPLALAAGLLWTVHPLQTESVTYIIQRAESIVALFYLLTLYCAVRGATGQRALFWYVASVAACLLGVGSKEVIVTAPVVVLLYDRAFLAGSFRTALRRRWGLYVALAATWGPLAWLVASASGRAGTAGFGTDVSIWSYAGTQFGVVARYLWLTVWPNALTFDYGTELAEGVGEILPPALLIAALLAGTIVALWRVPRLGFLGAAFFLLLAPSSSFVPVATQTIAEHRMYLPLAAVVAIVVVGVYAMLDRLGLRGKLARALPVMVLAGAAVALGWRTTGRNDDYRSELAIWQDTVAKSPDNARAHSNLGSTLESLSRTREAEVCFREAVRLDPEYLVARSNLGNLLLSQERIKEAHVHYEQVVRLQPGSADAHSNLGVMLALLGRIDEAMASYRSALAIDPDNRKAHGNLGVALTDLGHFDEAIVHCEAAVRLAPSNANAHSNLAAALAFGGRVTEAATHYETVVRLDPGNVGGRTDLGTVLYALGRIREAIVQYEEALRLDPGNEPLRKRIADLKQELGRRPEKEPAQKTSP